VFFKFFFQRNLQFKNWSLNISKFVNKYSPLEARIINSDEGAIDHG